MQMRRLYFVALAAASVLSFAMSGHRVEAMMPIASPGAGVATDTGLIHHVTVVCGNNGCTPVHTSPPRRRPNHP
jgi:hypothetical protein